MHPFDEMKSWLGYTEADAARLRAFWPEVEPRLDAVTGAFYDAVLVHPGAASVLQSAAQVERLRITLRQWLKELLLGPHDLAYYERRERIGRRHVEVGLHARYMFTAMHVVRERLCRIAHERVEQPRDLCLSLTRVTDMDLAIMNTTFTEGREQAQVTRLQELIVSNLPVAVYLLDERGRVTATTRPGLHLFGDHPADARSLADLLPPELVEGAGLRAHLERAMATNREITLTRVDTRVDGRERNFRITIVPLDHPGTRALLHLEELTDAISTEARLNRSESLAQLGALSAAVAHELRNPLAGISGAIQVIARSLPADDRRKPIMEKVEQQVHRLNALVTDLLDFARPVEPNLALVDLDDVARGVVELLAREHPRARLAVEGQGSAVADANFLQQVLLNLVINGIQAGGDEAEVRVIVGPGRVRVSDDGPGVPEANREAIFNPFFTTRTRGTGLGLAICRKQVTAMGGRIVLDQGPLRGAAFEIDLPTG